MNISVVVPVKNEAENVGPLLQEISTVLQGMPQVSYEIIFVDDGSTDQTPTILTGLAASFPALRILRHSRACGQSAAIYTGVRHAVYDYIVTLDGDGQNNPDDIPRFIEIFRKTPVHKKIGMVIGCRLNRRDSVIRRISSRIANSIRAALLHDATPDSGCGLKMLPRDLFLRLPFFDHMHRFMPALVIREGYAIESIPVHHRHRQAGVSKYGINNRLWVGIIDLFGVMWLIARLQRPDIKEIGK